MKVIFCVLIILIWLSSSTLAIAPVTNTVIEDAQNYGKTHNHTAWDDFVLPWTAYEEKATKLNEVTERAYLYTPYLLLASDAREKSLSGQSVKISNSEKLLTDYAGILSFSVTLLGFSPHFAQNSIASLRQDDKVIKTYQTTIPPEAEKTMGNLIPPLFTTQCYFYFSDKEIRPDKALVLSIITSNKQEHRFYFDTSKIK